MVVLRRSNIALQDSVGQGGQGEVKEAQGCQERTSPARAILYLPRHVSTYSHGLHTDTHTEIARGWCLRAEELHELSLELDEMYQDKRKRKKLRNPHGEHITHSDYDKMRTRLRRWQVDCLYDAMSHLKTGKRAMTAYEEDMHRHPHRYRERNTFRRPKTQILRDEQKVRNGLFLVYARQYARWSRPEMEEKGKGKADIYLDRAFHQIRIYEGLQGWASRNIHPLKMSSEMEEFRNEHEDEVFATRAKSEARSRDSSRSRVLKRKTARERRHSS